MGLVESNVRRHREERMKIWTPVVVFLLVIPLTCDAYESDESYERLVDEVLEVTGALKIGEQMSGFIVTEMVKTLKTVDPNFPDRGYDIMENEVNLTIKEAMRSGSFNDLMYPIYAKYLDASDLEAMIRFYSTKEGQKIASILPSMTQDGVVAGQQWGAVLGPQIAQRVQQRLADEGIEFP